MSSSQNHLPRVTRHKGWIKSTHWIVTLSFLLLLFTGYEILMVHPRLYWGETGNDLTPAFMELPISRNYKHGGFDKAIPFYNKTNSPVSAGRTYDIFNENGWGRSLHFLAAWFLVITGLIYLLTGLFTGYFRRHIWPRAREFSFSLFWQDLKAHLKKQESLEPGGTKYGLLQKFSYAVVIFFLLPLVAITGLTMSPAVTVAYPFLLKIFFGVQSARTIHFFASVALVLFLLVHVVMVVRTGFKKQMRAMTLGK
jgi:thiosulfate reductase cytochrome b subunit